MKILTHFDKARVLISTLKCQIAQDADLLPCG